MTHKLITLQALLISVSAWAPVAAEDGECSTLMQLPNHKATQLDIFVSEEQRGPPTRPNAAAFISQRGLDFALARAQRSLEETIAGMTILKESTVQIIETFGISLTINNLTVDGTPKLQLKARWAGEGVNIMVQLADATLEGGLQVTSPESEGQLKVSSLHANVKVGATASVSAHELRVQAASVDIEDLSLQVSVQLTCKNPHWSNFPACKAIDIFSGNIPSFFIDLVKGRLANSLESVVSDAINREVNQQLASIPRQFPLSFDDDSNTSMVMNFSFVNLTQSDDLKSVEMRAVAYDLDRPDLVIPVPGLAPPPDNVFERSMYSIALSGSGPNSILWVLQQEGVLRYAVEPQMVPEESPIQLDTNSLGAVFWAPWLKLVYALKCPFWKPCKVTADIRSSSAPALAFSTVVSLRLPISIDFNVTVDGNSEFLWRVNTTLEAGVEASIASGKNPCQQLLKVKVGTFSVSWIDVTKTQDDSWVATALSLNVALQNFADLVILPEVNAELQQGLPINPFNVGNSSYSLSNTSVDVSHGRFQLQTDIRLAENCTAAA